MTQVVHQSSALDNALHGEIIDPRERAEARFAELQASFARTLALLAAMHSDEDWRYLKKDDGSDYKGFTELVAVALECSASYARRYTQGITGLYVPLQEIVVEGTAIEITSSDVAILGADGARNVIEGVADRIDTIDSTPEAHADLVNDVIADQKQERQEQKVSRKPPVDDGRADPADEAGDVPLPGFDAVGGDTPPNGHDTPPSQFDNGGEGKASKKKSSPGADIDPDDDSEYEASGRGPVGDPLTRALVNCRTYSTDEDISDIGEPSLEELRRALNTVLRLDVDDVADAITSDRRGVLANSDEAANKIMQIRRIVQTSAAWVKS